MVSESLAEVLRARGFETVIASNSADFLALGTNPAVDALILDVHLGEEDGLAALSVLRTIRPALPVVVLTGFVSDDVRRRASDLRVAAVLSKAERLNRLFEVLASLFGYSARQRASAALPDFHMSPSKLRILELVAKGCTAAEIATTMGIAKGTANEHVAWLEHRLGARNRAQLVTEAMRLGFLPLPSFPSPR